MKHNEVTDMSLEIKALERAQKQEDKLLRLNKKLSDIRLLLFRGIDCLSDLDKDDNDD